MIGEVSGRLTILAPAGNDYWTCVCECGASAVVPGYNLRVRRTRSCGCLQRERARAAKITHGLRHSGTYESWVGMRARCGRANHRDYYLYGARGVTVCERWLESFQNFLTDMGERPAGMSIDRIENDGNYEPGNCRWATPKQQAANRHKRRPLAVCELCGGSERPHLYRPNPLSPERVTICVPCHAGIDLRDGVSRKTRCCLVCGAEFVDYSRSRPQTCSTLCRAESGRQSAIKRWGSSEDSV